MSIRSTLLVFLALLVLSISIAFAGYRYLSLASEYRERNFFHLTATQDLVDFLKGRERLVPAQIPLLRKKIDLAREQARWCLDTLSAFEKRLFEVMGAGPALDLCQDNLIMADFGDVVVGQIEQPDNLVQDQALVTFGPAQLLKGVALQMRHESEAFQPFVSKIEDSLKLIVLSATSVIGLAIGIVYLFVARSQLGQSREIEQLAAVAERANDAILIADKHGCVTWANPAFERLSGYSLSEVRGQKPGTILQGPKTDASTRKEISEALGALLPIRRDILNYTKAGQEYWISLSISPLNDEMGKFKGFVAISSDVTKVREQQDQVADVLKEIEYQARHDALTELPNRRFIDELLETEVCNSQPPRTLIRIDLDHFKNVNDTLGHAAGDAVLRTVSSILRSHVRADDAVGRVGGDEFVILLSKGTTSDFAVELANRLCAEIGNDIPFEGSICRVGASFGVASALDGLVCNKELLQAADAALYLAKNEGRNTTKLYTPDIHNSVNEHRRLSRDLEIGIANREFEAFYQLQFDAQTEAVVGVEALARWRHKERGILTPGAFLPVAEDLKLTKEIDFQVLESGLDRMQLLQAQGLGVPKIAFNCGLENLVTHHFGFALASRNLGDTKVAIEVLESVIVEEQGSAFRLTIDELRDYEIGIELDDFGSGHASVVGLQWLSPDAMKIDRQLVQTIGWDDTARKLVGSIIGMGRSLGIKVIAEGVETDIHAAILRNLGADVFQGYHYARPMSADELTAFLRHGRGVSLNCVESRRLA